MNTTTPMGLASARAKPAIPHPSQMPLRAKKKHPTSSARKSDSEAKPEKRNAVGNRNRYLTAPSAICASASMKTSL